MKIMRAVKPIFLAALAALRAAPALVRLSDALWLDGGLMHPLPVQ